MTALPLAVVIVSFNTAALLRACLRSLDRCTLPLHIVVVDHASSDGSAAMVQAEFPTVELIALDHNPGFAGGVNQGLAALSVSDYILILNPDTEVHAGALEMLVSFLAAHPRVGLVGPRLLNPDGTLQPAAFRFPTLLMTALDLFPPGEVLPGRLYGSWWHGRYPQESAAAPFAIDHPLGACMLVRSSTLAEVGSLDANYFMYSEEVEWCWRIRQAGWAIWQVPAARVTHVGGAATSQFRQRMFIALWRSRARFAAARGPAWRGTTHSLIVRAGMLRLSLCAWRDYFRKALPRAELQTRLLAYTEVARID